MSGKTQLPLLELDEVEGWMARNKVAASALGRHVCDDQSLVSRWRAGQSVSEAKKRLISDFVYDNPKGIPGYTGKTRKQRTGGWGYKTPTPKPTESHVDKGVPVPSIEALTQPHREWIKNRAFARGVAIQIVLVELVERGIACTIEDEYEESQSHDDNNTYK